MTFAANPPVLQAAADAMPRRHFLGAMIGAGAIPATTPAPIYGPEHLDEFGEWFVRLAIYPAGCPRPSGVEVEELTTPGWAATVERTRVNPGFVAHLAREYEGQPPNAEDPPVYRLPSDRDPADPFADLD